jgi:hypothetical protein
MGTSASIPKMFSSRDGQHMNPSGRRASGLLALCVSLLVAGSSHANINDVDHADDICPPAADPCVLSEKAIVDAGTTLDFGLRTFRIASNGQLDTGIGFVEVRCGNFIADKGSSPAIKARGSNGSGAVDGGSVVVLAQRGCSSAPSTPCVDDSDCSGGTCSVGSGDATLAGNIRAHGAEPGEIEITAAGSLVSTANIDVHGTVLEADGGSIELTAVAGDLSVSGKLDAVSGGLGGGGIITLVSSGDQSISGTVDANGGDFDAGAIEISADGDIDITGDLLASSVNGEGWGGEIFVSTLGGLNLGGSAHLFASGHMSAENFGGDGGEIVLEASEVVAGSDVRIESNGARPSGSGGTVDVLAERDITFGGVIETRGLGLESASGDISLEGCGISLVSGAKLQGEGPGGVIAVTGRGAITVASGAEIFANGDSAIEILYGDLGLPPQLSGSISPPPLITHLAFLGGCAICDDGLANRNGTASCDDSVDCTIDSCGDDGFCVSTPNDAACDDGNDCTTDTCTQAGCTNPSHAGACNDGIACTDGDVCIGGACTGEPQCQEGFFCSEAADACLPINSTTSTTIIVGPTTTTLSVTTTTTISGAVCGDGIVEGGEDCDPGTAFTFGDGCSDSCTRVDCGDPDNNGAVSAGDALFVLKVAVGLASCDNCVCNVDSVGESTTASDAFRTLRSAIGLPDALICPPCQ